MICGGEDGVRNGGRRVGLSDCDFWKKGGKLCLLL